MKDAKTVTEEFQQSVVKERSELDLLYAQLTKTNITQAERTRLIAEFNDQFGKYMDNLLSEKAGIDEIKKAYGEVITSMNDYYARKLLNEKTTKLFNDSAEEEAKLLSGTMNGVNSMTGAQKNRMLGYVSQVVNSMLAGGGSFGFEEITDKIYEEIRKNMGDPFSLLGGRADSWQEFAHSLTPYIRSVAERMSKINQIKNELSPFFKQADETIKDIPEIVVTGNNGKPSGASAGTASGDKDIALDEERRYQQELADLKKRYLDDDLMTHQQYNEELQRIEMEHLKKMFALYESDPEKQNEVNQRLLDMQIQMREDARKQEEKDKQEAADRAYENLEKRYMLEVEETTRQHYRLNTSEKVFRDELARLQQQFYDQVLSSSEVSEKKKQEIQKQSNDLALQQEKNSYNQRLQEAQTMKNMIIGTAEQMVKL